MSVVGRSLRDEQRALFAVVSAQEVAAAKPGCLNGLTVALALDVGAFTIKSIGRVLHIQGHPCSISTHTKRSNEGALWERPDGREPSLKVAIR